MPFVHRFVYKMSIESYILLHWLFLPDLRQHFKLDVKTHNKLRDAKNKSAICTNLFLTKKLDLSLFVFIPYFINKIVYDFYKIDFF